MLSKIVKSLTLAAVFLSAATSYGEAGITAGDVVIIKGKDSSGVFIQAEKIGDRTVFSLCQIQLSTAKKTCEVQGKAEGYTQEQLRNRQAKLQSDKNIVIGVATAAVVVGFIAGTVIGRRLNDFPATMYGLVGSSVALAGATGGLYMFGVIEGSNVTVDDIPATLDGLNTLLMGIK